MQNLKENPQKTVDRISECMTTTITVEGMSCGHCEQTVEEALKGVNGITDATADHEAEQATIEGDANSSELVEAVEDAGYTANV